MKTKLLRVGQTANLLGIHINTLRTLHKQGVFIPAKITDKGTRYYSEQQIQDYIGIKPAKQRKIVGYCRVSSAKQKQDLDRQVENIQTYMLSRGYQFEIITDVGSGINYTKKGLMQLIGMIENNEVEKIVVLYKDRLIRFGYELLEQICTIHNTQIEIIDNTERTEQQELVEDLINIITVFSCRLQGKRAKRTKEIIKELTNDIG